MIQSTNGRVIPFVKQDDESANRSIDIEILEREREETIASMSQEFLDDLDIERVIKGETD